MLRADACPLAAPPAADGERYPSLTQLAAAASGIVGRHPASCRLRQVGRSRSGLPLLLLSAGHGGSNILVTAGPHANEPVGGATALRLAELLLDDGELRSLPDTAWHLLLCLDPDGARRNKGWLRGPFTLHNYFRGIFRPHPGEQPEWFLAAPHSEAALPETRVLTRVIDDLRPVLQCSLHGVDVGGSFVQLTREVPGVATALGGSSTAQGIPLALGTQDASAWPSPGPGVYVLPAEATGVFPEDARLSTWSYMERHGGVTAVVESPMWAVDRVSDATPHASADRAVSEAADLLRDGCAQVAGLVAEVDAILPAARDPLVWAARGSLAFGPRLADHWGLEAQPDTTVAHVTDVEIMARRVPLRAAAMLSQLLEQASPWGPCAVGRARAELAGFVAESCTAVEREFAPRWVPISRQVEHQARTVLAIARLLIGD